MRWETMKSWDRMAQSRIPSQLLSLLWLHNLRNLHKMTLEARKAVKDHLQVHLLHRLQRALLR